MAIRFASFNPILDPWVYILCRKNLLLKGCERLKLTVARVKAGHADNVGWVESRHSPASLHSNDTSCASIRTAGDGEPRWSAQTKTFSDFTARQAWEYDTAQVSFHPFSVEYTAALGDERQAALKPAAHVRRVDIVTCTFSSPSSCQSADCL